ncbi:intradiol ring-cleavage dioxygenase [Algoriphagus aestuariicola]|uniref:Intradiol ring-cleavage dioxygenase n=1 Tax=Algoriphagus aestuariicola TaxID=1852016 RepID=A0ABS3BLV0_9BACT|nr:intradiol ring-cleavage dioxygenase [Algoriphagus aestuariicola]MBN7800259.1 intradiol ring-cleavage dioxygenase [Algoriphagus aestuariicola]
MKRKKFLKSGALSLGAIVALPTAIFSCSNEDENNLDSANCEVSPSETLGPFPIQSPAQLAQANIIGNRTGIPLLINLIINDQSNNCNPVEGVLVDIWHCDREGNYSQYGGNQLQSTDYRSQNFLRGRQTTDSNGHVSFISIFPGWYPGRAPHVHVEVLSETGISLLVTQIAFPVSDYTTIYQTAGYNGPPDRSNAQDGIFSDSLDHNMADSLTGNTTDGYTLLKTISIQ